jgi:uncharacterized protein (TIGR03118 family)
LCRPILEILEDRSLPSGSYLPTNLTSDVPGMAPTIDPNLVNPWGMASSPSGPTWVSDNGVGVSTLYNGQGLQQPSASAPLVVTIPPPAGSPAGTLASPTGIVFNGTSNFTVSANGASAPAAFLFATEDGTISGWNQTVDPTKAILEVDNSNVPAGNGAVYKGLTMANTVNGTFLYATNFRAGTVDVFDTNFHAATLAGSFSDPNLPAGFAPFGIQALGSNIYVTYAKQNDAKHDDVAGPGNGYVDVFDTSGNFSKRLVSQGPLNSPWGLALAPAQFGDFSNDLLVGNFGDGHINAFDPGTGTFLGPMKEDTGAPVIIDGLWGLRFGNNGAAGNANILYFTAGIDGETHGLFGCIAPIQTFATGADAGGGPQVNVYDGATGALKSSFFAYSPNFTGGVRVAVADVNGDGVPDTITGPGPGGGPEVRVFDGKTGAVILDFMAFDPNFTGGIYVAAGEFNGDTKADIVVGADAGGGPEVAVFSGADGHQIGGFFPYDPNFHGGVRVATGDVNGDGHDDIITAAGPGGGPHVQVFDGSTIVNNGNPIVLDSFFAFDPNFTGGVYVAAGDVNGDGRADITAGTGAGTTANVRVYSGADLSLLQNFSPYSSFQGGVRVAIISDVNGDGKADFVTAPGPGGGPDVVVCDGITLSIFQNFFAYDPNFAGGVFVGAR